MVKFINFVPELRKYLNMKLLKLLLLLPVVAGSVSCGSGNSGSSGWPDPVITGVETAYDGKVIAGEPVTLKGKNFSAQASDNKVLYGVGLDATALRVSEATETSVVFTAPENVTCSAERTGYIIYQNDEIYKQSVGGNTDI